MILRLNGKDTENGRLTIENLRNDPTELVEKLRGLLSSGVEARPDPRRRGFYDVHSGTRVFFIHVSPVSGNVLLLASWPNEAERATEAVRVPASERPARMACADQAA